MRHIGTLTDSEQAQTFVDYLLVRGIQAKADREPDGWALWVLDEDSVAGAKLELDEFQRNPGEPRFLDAAAEAAALRKDSERRQAQARRKVIDVKERWQRPLMAQIPVTFLLGMLCFGLTMITGFGSRAEPLTDQLLFSQPPEPGMAGLQKYMRESPFARIREGQVWRLITPIFLHANGLHLMMNFYWLIVLGGMIEFRQGSRRMIFLVLAFALISNISQALYQGPNFLGFSGVGYGLFAYVWISSRYIPEAGLYLSPANVAMWMVWFFVCLTGAVGDIANAAHWSGLVSGMVFAYFPRLFSRAH